MKKTLIIPLTLLFLLILPIQNIYAGVNDYDDFTIPNSQYSSIRELAFHHSSGKFVTAIYNDTANEGMYWMIYSSDGTLQATGSQEIINHLYVYEAVSIKVHEIDDDRIGIVFITTYYGTGWYLTFNVITVDLDTYTNTYDYVSNGGDPGRQYPSKTIGVVEYNDNFYYLFTSISDDDNTEWKLVVNEFDPSTDTLTERLDSSLGTSTSSSYGGNLYAFSNPDNATEIYFVTSLQADLTLPKYYKMDLDDYSYELLATHPLSNYWESDTHLEFVKGGVEIDPDNTDDIFLYFTWVLPRKPATYPTFRLVQHRLRFNITITSSELEVQNRRVLDVYPNAYAGSDELWCFTYMANDTFTELTMYYPYYTGLNPYKVRSTRYNITDWYNTATNEITVHESETDLEDTIPMWSGEEDGYVSRSATSDFCLYYNKASDEARVYYDLDVPEMDYDITMTYTPADDPLILDKSYRFYIDVYGNGRGVQRNIIIFQNDVQKAVGVTDTEGHYEFIMFTNVPGIHTFKVEVYLYGSERYEEEFSYVFDDESVSTTPTPDIMMTQTLTMLYSFIPIGAGLIIPTILFYSLSKNFVGLILGFNIGIVICAMGGIIPTYFVFLAILIDAMAFILISRRGY